MKAVRVFPLTKAAQPKVFGAFKDLNHAQRRLFKAAFTWVVSEGYAEIGYKNPIFYQIAPPDMLMLRVREELVKEGLQENKDFKFLVVDA